MKYFFRESNSVVQFTKYSLLGTKNLHLEAFKLENKASNGVYSIERNTVAKQTHEPVMSDCVEANMRPVPGFSDHNNRANDCDIYYAHVTRPSVTRPCTKLQ